jgi:hypothetical protein
MSLVRSQKLGGLKLLLRFSADACLDTSEDDLVAAFSQLDVKSSHSTSTEFSSDLVAGTSSVKGLHILVPKSGLVQPTPHANLIEVKTRSVRNLLDWNEAYPQLQLSQTPYMYLAKHERGAFGEPEKYALQGQSMEAYERTTRGGLVALYNVLKEILETVRIEGQREPSPGSEFGLVCVDGQLSLRRREEGTSGSIGRDILHKFK